MASLGKSTPERTLVRSSILPLIVSFITIFNCVPSVAAQSSYRLQRPSGSQQSSIQQDFSNAQTNPAQSNYSNAPRSSYAAPQSYSSYSQSNQSAAQQNSAGTTQFTVRPATPAAAPVAPSEPLFGKADAMTFGKSLLQGLTGTSIQRQSPFVGTVRDSFVPPQRQAYIPPQQSLSGGAYAVASVAELKRISNRDVVIIIDKSGSMSEADCPSDNMPATMSRLFFGIPSPHSGAITRWEWCQRQTTHVAQQLQRMPGNKIKLVLFDSRVTEFDNVSISAISGIFHQYRPNGSTNATKALKTVFQDYLDRKKQFGNVKPLSVVFITDGAPSSPTSLKDLIVETSLKISNPNEIALSFLQIGNDDDGARLLPELDFNMVNEGARYDIVSSRNFASVSRTGLLRALLDTAR